jgi:hypothetical protein
MLPNRGMVGAAFEPPILELGTYRHYKGGLYQVIGLACHEETHRWLVIYKPLYEHQGMPDLWARPYEVFTETIMVGDATVPRFTYVSKEIIDEV